MVLFHLFFFFFSACSEAGAQIRYRDGVLDFFFLVDRLPGRIADGMQVLWVSSLLSYTAEVLDLPLPPFYVRC